MKVVNETGVYYGNAVNPILYIEIYRIALVNIYMTFERRSS